MKAIYLALTAFVVLFAVADGDCSSIDAGCNCAQSSPTQLTAAGDWSESFETTDLLCVSDCTLTGVPIVQTDGAASVAEVKVGGCSSTAATLFSLRVQLADGLATSALTIGDKGVLRGGGNNLGLGDVTYGGVVASGTAGPLDVEAGGTLDADGPSSTLTGSGMALNVAGIATFSAGHSIVAAPVNILNGGLLTWGSTGDLSSGCPIDVANGGTLTVNSQLNSTDTITVGATGTLNMNAPIDLGGAALTYNPSALTLGHDLNADLVISGTTVTLSSDVTLHSLTLSGAPTVDLDGNTLTIVDNTLSLSLVTISGPGEVIHEGEYGALVLDTGAAGEVLTFRGNNLGGTGAFVFDLDATFAVDASGTSSSIVFENFDELKFDREFTVNAHPDWQPALEGRITLISWTGTPAANVDFSGGGANGVGAGSGTNQCATGETSYEIIMTGPDSGRLELICGTNCTNVVCTQDTSECTLGVDCDSCYETVCDEASGGTCIPDYGEPLSSACTVDEGCLESTTCNLGLCVGTNKTCDQTGLADTCQVNECRYGTTGDCELYNRPAGTSCNEDGLDCTNEACSAGGLCLVDSLTCLEDSDNCTRAICFDNGGVGECQQEPITDTLECATDPCTVTDCSALDDDDECIEGICRLVGVSSNPECFPQLIDDCTISGSDEPEPQLPILGIAAAGGIVFVGLLALFVSSRGQPKSSSESSKSRRARPEMQKATEKLQLTKKKSKRSRPPVNEEAGKAAAAALLNQGENADLSEFREYLLEESVFTLALVAAVPQHKYGRLATGLVKVFEAEGRGLEMLDTFISDHVKACSEESELMRTTTFASHLMTKYFDIVGAAYMRNVLTPAAKFIKATSGEKSKKGGKGGKKRELDPRRASRLSTLERSKTELSQLGGRIADKILASKPPNNIRGALNLLYSKVDKKWPSGGDDIFAGEMAAGLRMVGQFFLTRFLTPALTLPHERGLAKAKPSEEQQRALTLVAKLLNGLAVATEFGGKEDFMSSMSDFQEKYRQKMLDLLTNLAKTAPGKAERALTKKKQVAEALVDIYDLASEYSETVRTELAKDKRASGRSTMTFDRLSGNFNANRASILSAFSSGDAEGDSEYVGDDGYQDEYDEYDVDEFVDDLEVADEDVLAGLLDDGDEEWSDDEEGGGGGSKRMSGVSASAVSVSSGMSGDSEWSGDGDGDGDGYVSD